MNLVSEISQPLFFYIIQCINLILICVVIYKENGNPTRTIVWILLSCVFPLLGFILYMLFSNRFRKNRDKFLKHHVNKKDKLADSILLNDSLTIKQLNQNYSDLISLISNTGHYPVTTNNYVEIYSSGKETFFNFFDSIKKATHHVHLLFYIFNADDIGEELQQLLIEKAHAGVEVRIIYDQIGSRKMTKTYLNTFFANNIQVACYKGNKFPFFSNRINYRNHRKVLVIDGVVGFLGGNNIGDEYLGRDKKFHQWRDTHMKILGDGTKYLQNIFFLDWYRITGEYLDGKVYYPIVKEKQGNSPLQIVTGGPTTRWETIMHLYFTLISSAKASIYLTTPYFIPNDSILIALKNAALRGIDVHILIPGKPDKKIVLWASLSYLKELLEAGVKVYQYEAGFIHAKTIVIDDQLASIGSANLDLRSFDLNFEANCLIYEPQTALKVKHDFLEDLKHSEELTLERYNNLPITIKFLQSLARLCSPIL